MVLGAFSLSASFDRTSSGRDAKQAVSRSSNELRTIARNKLDEAQQDRRDAERRIKDEAHPSCNWPKYQKTKTCPKWGRAMTELKDAKQRIIEARADLKKHPVAVIVDPAGKRISKMLSIEQETYNRWQPVLLPVGLQLGGLLFIWLAFSGSPSRLSQSAALQVPPRKKTKRQLILELNQTILQVDGRAPSQAWIAEQINCAKSTVSGALQNA